MKTLCLFTNEFPYGVWEPYLETEIKYYDQFEKVYVFSLQLRHEHAKTCRDLPKKFKIFPIYYAPKWRYLINSVTALGDSTLYREITELKKTKRFGIRQLISLFVYISRSHYEADKIYSKLQEIDFSDTIFYSYRFEYQPYVAILLRKKLGKEIKIVTRAHRFDLYEQFRKNKYIPCRTTLLDELEKVYPCSDHGTNYLQKLFPEYQDKIETRFLGTIDHGIEKYVDDETFRIVSCSTAMPVKRVHLIIEALSLIKEKKIKWTHFGDGPLLEELKERACSLTDNINVDFRGNVKNSDLLDNYANHTYDLFINVSDSEGIPVSIMEAMSFGIPCLATNAGGTGEIIKNGEGGVLIPVEVTGEDIMKNIKSFMLMDKSEYMKCRELSRKRWNEKFNAENNYHSFAQELSQYISK